MIAMQRVMIAMQHLPNPPTEESSANQLTRDAITSHFPAITPGTVLSGLMVSRQLTVVPSSVPTGR